MRGASFFVLRSKKSRELCGRERGFQEAFCTGAGWSKLLKGQRPAQASLCQRAGVKKGAGALRGGGGPHRRRRGSLPRRRRRGPEKKGRAEEKTAGGGGCAAAEKKAPPAGARRRRAGAVRGGVGGGGREKRSETLSKEAVIPGQPLGIRCWGRGRCNGQRQGGGVLSCTMGAGRPGNGARAQQAAGAFGGRL